MRSIVLGASRKDSLFSCRHGYTFSFDSALVPALNSQIFSNPNSFKGAIFRDTLDKCSDVDTVVHPQGYLIGKAALKLQCLPISGTWNILSRPFGGPDDPWMAFDD